MTKKRVVQLLLGAAFLLAAAHAVNEALGWPSWLMRYFFDMDRECTIQSWFSSMIWFFCAQKAFACSRMKASASSKPCWMLLTFFFGLCSLDEVAMFHERFGKAFYKFLHPHVSEALALHAHWVLALTPILLIGGFCVCRAFLRCFEKSPQVAQKVCFGFALVIVGAVVLEALMVHDGQTPDLMVQLEVVFEETMEMLGVITILSGVLAYQEQEEKGTLSSRV